MFFDGKNTPWKSSFVYNTLTWMFFLEIYEIFGIAFYRTKQFVYCLFFWFLDFYLSLKLSNWIYSQAYSGPFLRVVNMGANNGWEPVIIISYILSFTRHFSVYLPVNISCLVCESTLFKVKKSVYLAKLRQQYDKHLTTFCCMCQVTP